MVIDHGSLKPRRVSGRPAQPGRLHPHKPAGASSPNLAPDGAHIEVAGATVRRVDGPRQWLSFPTEASAAPLVAVAAASYDVADLSILEPAIETSSPTSMPAPPCADGRVRGQPFDEGAVGWAGGGVV